MPTMLGRHDAQGRPTIDLPVLDASGGRAGVLRCGIDTGYKGFILATAPVLASLPAVIPARARVSPIPGAPPVGLAYLVVEWFGQPQRVAVHVGAHQTYLGGPDAKIGYLLFWHHDCRLEIDWSVKPNIDGGVRILKA